MTVAIPAALSGERLDKALTSLLPQLSRSRLQALLELGQVSHDGARGSRTVNDASARVKPGEIYTVLIPAAVPSELQAQEIPLAIIYEDAHLLILNKPPGLVVHPAPGNPDSTLVNALLAHCGESLSGIGGVARPGIVHRIDKDTSGLLVVAKHDAAHQHLSAQLQDRSLKRTYLALVWGKPSPPSGTITGNIGRHPRNRQKMAVVKSGGKHAATHYKVIEHFGGEYALVECNLETGRTHQIRVHLAHLKHPLVGDGVYGKKGLRGEGRGASEKNLLTPHPSTLIPSSFSRQALHAYRLALIHPASGEAMTFEAPLPEDMNALLVAVRQHFKVGDVQEKR